MKIPLHVAFIPDGNGRWAQQNHYPVEAGHHRGVEVLETILDECYEIGVKVVTVFAFSSENWKRPLSERNVLFSLINFFLLNKLITKKVQLKIIGDWTGFPESLQADIKKAVERTANFDRCVLQIALGYSGRDEIVRAVRKTVQAVTEGRQKLDDLDETSFKQYLDTSGTVDPDFIIRTSGEYRISNFLLFQMAYSELYFTPTLWPDFTTTELRKALEDFSRRERRFGKRPKVLKS